MQCKVIKGKTWRTGGTMLCWENNIAKRGYSLCKNPESEACGPTPRIA